MKKILLFLCILITSCVSNDKESFLNEFSEKENIALIEVFPELKRQLQKPSFFYCLNQYLVFSEPDLDSLIFVYDSQTNEGKYFFSKGQGENEAIKINKISMGTNSSSCSLYDSALQRIYILNLKKSFESSVEKDTLASLYGMGVYMAYDDTLSFYEMINSEKRFLLSTPNKTIRFGNDIPLRGLSSEMSTKVLQGPCSLSSSRKRFFWFSSFGDVFEMYDYSNVNEIKTVASQVINVPAANVNGALGSNDRFGVSSVASDDSCIYALYLGKTLKDGLSDRAKALYSDIVLVFDWDGVPYKLLNLDREVCSISYSKTDKKLYGLGLDDNLNYTVYEIKMKK